MSLGARRERRQGILPFMAKRAERDDVTARAGLPLVIETARALRLDEEARNLLGPPRRASDFGPDEKLEALAMLIAAGGDRLEDIRILSEDPGWTTRRSTAVTLGSAAICFSNSWSSSSGSVVESWNVRRTKRDALRTLLCEVARRKNWRGPCFGELLSCGK